MVSAPRPNLAGICDRLSEGHIGYQRCVDTPLYRRSRFLGECGFAYLYKTSRANDLVLSKTPQHFLFDFDGVLADSEIHTLPTIKLIAARHAFSSDILRDEYGGWTWAAIADELLADIASHTAALPSTDILSDELAAAFSQSVLSSPVAVPGAIEAVKAAAQVGRVAVVTGSRGALVEAWLNHFHIRRYVELIVSAETYERAKPAPDDIAQRLSASWRSRTRPSCLKTVRLV